MNRTELISNQTIMRSVKETISREIRGNRLSPRSLSRERSQEAAFRMEAITSKEASEGAEEAQETQETSFEGGTTWYTGDTDQGGQESPRNKGAVQEV